MNILGLDTSTTGCSVAVLRDGKTAARQGEEMVTGQAENLNPMIGRAMAAAKLGFAGLDGVGVTIGPGSFTGVRIGLAAARAVGLGAGVPVIGVTTFAALARAVPAPEMAGRTTVVAVNGKRRDVFVQLIDDDGTMIGEPLTLDPAAVPDSLPAGPVLIAGDGGPQLAVALEASLEAGSGPENRIRLSAAMSPPDALHVAALAGEVLAKGGVPQNGPRPLYVRPPDVRLPNGRAK